MPPAGAVGVAEAADGTLPGGRLVSTATAATTAASTASSAAAERRSARKRSSRPRLRDASPSTTTSSSVFTISVLPYEVVHTWLTALSSHSARSPPVTDSTITDHSASRENLRLISARTRCRSGSASPRVACGVTHTSWSRPPIQIAAAATWAASNATTSAPRPGSPAWPEMPGAASAQMPAAAAGTASAIASRRPRPTAP